MILIDGKKIRNRILEKVKTEIKSLPFTPVFTDILVGEDPVSLKYVNMKAKMAEENGISFRKSFFDKNITNEELVAEIQKINKEENMCGIIVQLPLPAHLDKKKILDAVSPKLDVDCLGEVCGDLFYKNETNGLSFPTALACLEVFKETGQDLKNKNVVIFGYGELVGRPLERLLNKHDIYPSIIKSDTLHKEEILKKADVIFCGVGKPNILKGNFLKEGVVLIDAGTFEVDGSLVGDVDMDSVKDSASFLSPVPGGVGPVTVAMLLVNILKVAKEKIYESSKYTK
jgi:methylenetetrahydrofolate dehydrogenase (NADP+)/methenyltetrahydrofolate cyclohydrolase